MSLNAMQSNLQKKFLLNIAALISAVTILSLGGCATVQSKEIKDTIDHLSFSHDGRKVLFDRCRADSCQIQVYDLETGELSAYQSPPNERWTMARQSYDGKKIVFATIPMGEEYLDLSGMQIAVMDVDGKNYKRLTSGHFPKLYPTFSHSGKKVLYVKASRMRKQGRTPASGYDAWEVDIETGENTRLTFFEYMFMASVVYFPLDEKFLYHASGPFAFPGLDLTKYDAKDHLKMIGEEALKRNTPLGGILTMKRGELYPERPYNLFEKGHPPTLPMLSKDGRHLYFEAEGMAGQFFHYSPDGKHRLIANIGSFYTAAISPDGDLLGTSGSESIDINRVQDGNHCRVIVFQGAVQRNKNWDYAIKKNPQKIKILPEWPIRMLNQ